MVNFNSLQNFTIGLPCEMYQVKFYQQEYKIPTQDLGLLKYLKYNILIWKDCYVKSIDHNLHRIKINFFGKYCVHGKARYNWCLLRKGSKELWSYLRTARPWERTACFGSPTRLVCSSSKPLGFRNDGANTRTYHRVMIKRRTPWPWDSEPKFWLNSKFSATRT